MEKVNIKLFKSNFDINLDGSEALYYKFTSGKLDFKIILTPIKMDIKDKVVNIRIIANKTVSSQCDFTAEFLERNPVKCEYVLLHLLFSNKVSNQIIKNISPCK